MRKYNRVNAQHRLHTPIQTFVTIPVGQRYGASFIQTSVSLLTVYSSTLCSQLVFFGVDVVTVTYEELYSAPAADFLWLVSET